MALFLSRPRLWGPFLALTAAALALPVAGCTGGGGPKGSVSGKVTYEGKAVRSGSVMIVSGGARPVYAQIDDEGKYEAQGVPAGPATFTVTSPDPKGGRRERVAKDAPKDAPVVPQRGEKGPEVKGWFPLPDPYSDPARSGLSFDVKAGPNTYDIALKKPPPS